MKKVMKLSVVGIVFSFLFLFSLAFYSSSSFAQTSVCSNPLPSDSACLTWDAEPASSVNGPNPWEQVTVHRKPEACAATGNAWILVPNGVVIPPQRTFEDVSLPPGAYCYVVYAHNQTTGQTSGPSNMAGKATNLPALPDVQNLNVVLLEVWIMPIGGV